MPLSQPSARPPSRLRFSFAVAWLAAGLGAWVAGCGEEEGDRAAAEPDAGVGPDAGAGDAATASPDAGEDVGSDAGVPDPLAVTGPEVTVETALGPVVGALENGDTHVFLGIPYAKPPTGERRFAPPEPVQAWSEPRTARRYGAACPQAPATIGGFPEDQKDEDCLTLNVFAPADADGLPVMVFLHGGAFVSGGSASAGYEGTLLSREGVVLVTVNYRVGALGFLSLPALDDARGEVPSGNDGLLDQRLALRWVRDHIAAFGGAADNVTVFGESAGAASVCAHNLSPGSAGLADRYIMESGVCIGGIDILDKVDADSTGARLVDALCAGEADVLACLRSLDWQTLVAWGADEGISGAGWGPVVDPAGDVLPEDPRVVLAEGRGNPGSVLLGTNEAEWRLFTLFNLAPLVRTEEELDASIAELVGEDAVAAVRAQYPVPDGADGTAFNEVNVEILTDAVFRCPTRDYARLRSDTGGSVFLYSFEYGDAIHATELSYVFGNPNTFLAPDFSADLSQAVRGYWARFAATGDPNGGDAVVWPAYDTQGDSHLRFDAEVEASSGLSSANCDFWAALTAGG